MSPNLKIKSYKDVIIHLPEKQTPLQNVSQQAIGLVAQNFNSPWNEIVLTIMECSWDDESQLQTNCFWSIATN